MSGIADQALTTGHGRSRPNSMAVTLILILGALGIALAALMGTPDGNRNAPTLDVINRSGLVQISNSREGLPIVSVANLKPGQTASGTVTLQNVGSVRGYFYLAPLDLVSPPGPGGGTLAQNLIVRVVLTKGGTTSQKYRAALSNMGTIRAGNFRPGESRTYKFEVQAKDTGIPAPPTHSRPVRGDNKYQGTSASVTFGWSTSRDSTGNHSVLDQFIENGGVRVSAKADYAVRAAIELASGHDSGPMKGEQIAEAQDIPVRFLENILGDLRHHGLIESRRGAEGGYWLSRPPDEITIGEVMRAAEGPLANVRGERPDELEYRGSAQPLREVWVALRNNVRGILDNVTLADVIADNIPTGVKELGKKPDLRAY